MLPRSAETAPRRGEPVCQIPLVRRRSQLRAFRLAGLHPLLARPHGRGRIQPHRRGREARRGRRPLQERFHARADRLPRHAGRPSVGLPAMLPRRGRRAQPAGDRLDDDLPSGARCFAPGARIPRPGIRRAHLHHVPSRRAVGHPRRPLHRDRLPQPRDARESGMGAALRPRAPHPLPVRRLCPRLLPLSRGRSRLLGVLTARFRGVPRASRRALPGGYLHLRRARGACPGQILQTVVGVPCQGHPQLHRPRAGGDRPPAARRGARILGRLVAPRHLRQRAELGKPPLGILARIPRLLGIARVRGGGLRRPARRLHHGHLPRTRTGRRRSRIGGIRAEPLAARRAGRLHGLRIALCEEPSRRVRGCGVPLPPKDKGRHGLRHRAGHQERTLGRHPPGHRPRREGSRIRQQRTDGYNIKTTTP